LKIENEKKSQMGRFVVSYNKYEKYSGKKSKTKIVLIFVVKNDLFARNDHF